MRRHRNGPDANRRDVLIQGVRLALWTGVASIANRFPAFAQQPAGGRGRTGGPQASPAGTQLVLLGTQGGPNINLQRTETASAIVVDGRPYLVDCGYGTVRALVAAGIGYQQIATVFLTHLHDDHTSDLPALLTHQWTGSRQGQTDVYGPYGTAALMAAAIAFMKPNADIRIVDEGRKVRPDTLYHGHDVAATPAPIQAFADDKVKVSSVENGHYPDRSKAGMPYRSLAYRFETPTRAIVISGDTAYSPAVVALAKGADLFVCEVMDLAIYDTMMAQAKAAADAGNPNSVARHVAETHSTTVDAGRMAAEANVKTLVLTHLLPGSNRTRGGLTSFNGAGEFPDTTYIDGVRKYFSGQVIIGRDEMVL